MAKLHEIPEGRGRNILLVIAHGDDPALFLGGTLIRFARAGWRLACIRATDDATDSIALTPAETIAANAGEFRAAAGRLGIAEIIDLGFRTDTLADISHGLLRERIIREIRRLKPHALMTFDPYAMYGEDNQDHLRLAAAADEAFWTSQFAKHHPEHLAEGLHPHGVFERWYFGRELTRVTDVIDISSVLEEKIAAALEHKTMLAHIAHQWRLQAATGGYAADALGAASAGEGLALLFAPLLRSGAERLGARYGIAAAEVFRVVRFGGLEDWLLGHGRPLPLDPPSAK